MDFSKLNNTNNLIPAIIQHAHTCDVLMLGFMNEEAYQKTRDLGKVTFFSRTKNRLWTKGEESGNFLNVVSLHVDCDDDTILIKALPVGPTCHTGAETCFNDQEKTGLSFLSKLEDLITDRKNNENEKSYVRSLFQSGINKVAQKVGEEAVEVVIEAKDDNEELFLSESADLLFHYLILLQAKGHTLKDVLKVLESRQK